MKILHIVPSYLPAYGYGGPIQSVHNLNKWLVKKGMDVTVYTTNIDGRKRLNVPTCEEVVLDGVKVRYFPITFAPWQYSSAMKAALEENAGGFDLIHITSVFLSASTLGAYYAKKFGIPYIISPRGSLMKEPLRKKSAPLKKIYIAIKEKNNLAGAAAIHFTAEDEKKEYIEAGLPLRNSFIVPNGLDTDTFDKEIPEGMFRKKFGIAPDKKVVLSLGRLSWKKGFDTLIPAFKKVAEKESKSLLVIAGGDNEGYRKTIEKLIAENGLESENFLFTGELLGDIKLAAFRESDVFVLPSYSENFGMSVAEAMSLKTPVMTTSGTAIAWFIEKDDAGIVLAKDDTGAWAEKMLWLFDHPKEAKEMGDRERKVIEEDLSMEKVTNMMAAEYNRILKNG